MKIQKTTSGSDLFFVSPDECKTIAQYNLLCEYDDNEQDWLVAYFNSEAEVKKLIDLAKATDKEVQKLLSGRIGLEVRITHRGDHAFYRVFSYTPKDNEGYVNLDENETEYNSHDPLVSPENIVRAVAHHCKFSDLSLQGQYEAFKRIAPAICVEVATSYTNKDDRDRIGSLGVGLVYGYGAEQ